MSAVPSVAEAELRLAEAKENARMCLQPPCGNCRTGMELARQALRAAQATPEDPKQSGASEVQEAAQAKQEGGTS